MFSTNPILSTIHVFPPFITNLDHQKPNHYINHNPFLTGDDLVEPQGSSLEQQCDEYNHLFWSEVKNEKPTKKDHHSKIHTAKGPRDRRVRLSIEVAKKFFFLQDLLEVDKASKTLDWLFNKSKISIDELIKRKKDTSSSTVVTDQSEVIFLETGADEQAKGRKKKATRNYKSGLNQLRADARARARARTKEKKLNIKKLDNECCSSNLTFQSSFWNSVESNKIGESIMEDNNISMLYIYQHNLAHVSNDSSSKSTTCLPGFTDVHDQWCD